MSTPPQLANTQIDQLRADLNGRVIAPDDPAYDEARTVFFTGFDRRPAAIVRVADSGDVSRVVTFARDSGLELAVRSGGHSTAGHSSIDGGIVLDLSRMRALDIEAGGRTAWAETGLRAGEYTTSAGGHGLATGFGDTGTVGIGGITLGGGVGFLVRKHGMTIDDLLGAELVTADGELLQVDDESHPDLFWAIRGGGGNFGVATRFRFRLHEVDEIVGGLMMLPATPELIVSFIAEAEAAPEELSTIAGVMLAPPAPFVPAEHQNRPVLMVQLVHAGAREAGERAISSLRALATPVVDMVRPMRYPEIYELVEGPRPVGFAVRNLFVDSIDQRSAETILDHIENSSAPRAAVQLRVLGGAMGRVPDDATAFAHRGRRIMVNVAAMFERMEEAAEHEASVTRTAEALLRGEAATYLGFGSDDGEALIREAYPGATLDRLKEIKGRYDPTNLFRLNHNIPPA